MNFLKNIQFTHLIKIDGHLKEFNFRKSNGSLETIFTVDTIDARGKRIVFNMYDECNVWKLKQEELPNWIIENQNHLNESIRKELAVQEIYFVRPADNTVRQLSRFFSLFGLS